MASHSSEAALKPEGRSTLSISYLALANRSSNKNSL